jgi:hypothetical protein
VANVLEIALPDWYEVSVTENVVNVQTQEPPEGPATPLASYRAWVWEPEEQNDCTIDDTSGDPTLPPVNALIHEANSGWWFNFASAPGGGVLLPSGTIISARDYFEGLLAGYDLTTGGSVAIGCYLNLASLAYAIPPGWEGCNYDAWTYTCEVDPVVINIQILPGITPSPPSQLQQPCCVSYSFWNGGCCLRGPNYGV